MSQRRRQTRRRAHQIASQLRDGSADPLAQRVLELEQQLAQARTDNATLLQFIDLAQAEAEAANKSARVAQERMEHALTVSAEAWEEREVMAAALEKARGKIERLENELR